VGQPPQLGEEFVKANPAAVWRERVLWICLAIFLLSIFDDVFGSLSRAMMPVRGGSIIDRLELPEILNLLAFVIPWIVVVLLASGKMVRLFSKLRLVIESRLRFAIMALILITASITIGMGASAMYNTRIYYPVGHGFLIPIWRGFYFDCIYKFIFALSIIWIIPPQNRKTPKRA
jgi:hypothetical protein